MVEIEEAIQLCNSKSNKEAIIACKFELLHKITEKQDIVNLNLMKTLDDDADERWYPIHMVDNANAIILGISQNKGRPKSILRGHYVEEKITSLDEKWSYVKKMYGD